ncbi:MAG: hypothetical protein NTV85_28510, partial [Hyphomicrobiales bacterium]|nr:hypothetical protein [Hyphomicrobiales bacterium]
RDFGPDSPMAFNAGNAAVADATGQRRPAPFEQRAELQDLGHGYVRNLQLTLAARAESTRRAREDELAAAGQGAGLSAGDARYAALNESAAGPMLASQRAERKAATRRRQVASFGPEAELFAEDAPQLYDVLRPVVRETPEQRQARELGLIDARGRWALREAGVRATNDRSAVPSVAQMQSRLSALRTERDQDGFATGKLRPVADVWPDMVAEYGTEADRLPIARGMRRSVASAAQRDWDALPGTPEDKIARVGPRPPQ